MKMLSFRFLFIVLISTILCHLVLSIPQQELESNGRIYGGVEAAPNEFPWMAFVTAYAPQGFGILCGGSLISNRYVLTYADCLSWVELDFVQVILGAHDLSKPTEPYRVTVKSNTYFFSAGKLILILLPNPVIFTPQIRPIALPSVYDSVSPEETVTLIGWSRSDNDLGVYNKPLRKVDVKLATNEMCGLASSNDKNFCTSGEGGKGTCGDNGGPVNYYKKTSENWTLMGVTGSNSPCGDGRPSYHIRVQPFLEWIYNTTGMTNPDPDPTTSTTQSTVSSDSTDNMSSSTDSSTILISVPSAAGLSIHQLGLFAPAALHFLLQSLLFRK